MAFRANILILVWLTKCVFQSCVLWPWIFFFHPFSLSLACNPLEIGLEPIRKGETFWMNKTTDLSQYGTERKYRTRINNSMTVTFFSFLNRKSSNTDFLWWCAYHKVVWISVCQFIHFPLLHCFLSSGRNTVRSLLVYLESLGIACVAGVKMGKERGNLGTRERAREKGKEPSSLLPRAWSRALNSLPLPFRTPATQGTLVITRLTEFGWNAKGEGFLQAVWSGGLHSTFQACFEQCSRIYLIFREVAW